MIVVTQPVSLAGGGGAERAAIVIGGGRGFDKWGGFELGGGVW